jgi:membrane protein DedA with SNARE-associated domain
MIDRLLQWMTGLPEALIYAVVGVFAALENIFPPVPADVIALFGGFLAGRGAASPWAAFLVVWLANVAGALLVYAAGRRYGTSFFHRRLGAFILQPGQFATVAEFYARHGAKVIFVSRFLPMFRAVVPIVAGTTGVGWARTAVPLATASAIWYGAIVYLGATAGRNWGRLREMVDASGHWLLAAASVLLVLVGWWWWHSRRRSAP